MPMPPIGEGVISETPPSKAAFTRGVRRGSVTKIAITPLAPTISSTSNLSASSVVSVGDESRATHSKKSPRASERKLEDELNLLRMDELKRMFFEADEDGNGALDIEEFITTIGGVLAGPSATREKLVVLFRRMDANMDNMVDWDEFSDFMLLEGLSKDTQELTAHSFVSRERMARPAQSQHTTSLRSIAFAPNLQKYYTASSDSTIRVWSETMQHQKTIRLEQTVLGLAVLSIGDGGMLVAATTRSVAFFDLVSMEMIDALPCDASVLCVDAWTHKGTQWVAFGDDQGYIHLVNPPGTGPLHKKRWDKHSKPYWSSKRHDDWVSKIQHVHDLGCLVSCANDGKILLMDATNGFRISESADRETLPIKCIMNEDGLAHARGVRSFVWCKYTSNPHRNLTPRDFSDRILCVYRQGLQVSGDMRDRAACDVVEQFRTGKRAARPEQLLDF